MRTAGIVSHPRRAKPDHRTLEYRAPCREPSRSLGAPARRVHVSFCALVGFEKVQSENLRTFVPAKSAFRSIRPARFWSGGTAALLFCPRRGPRRAVGWCRADQPWPVGGASPVYADRTRFMAGTRARPRALHRQEDQSEQQHAGQEAIQGKGICGWQDAVAATSTVKCTSPWLPNSRSRYSPTGRGSAATTVIAAL